MTKFNPLSFCVTGLFLAVVCLTVGSNRALAQVVIDGTPISGYYNTGNAGTVDMHGSSSFHNRDGASIVTANRYDTGHMQNQGTGSIETLNIYNYGNVDNIGQNYVNSPMTSATIDTANVYDYGILYNWSSTNDALAKSPDLTGTGILGTVNVYNNGQLQNMRIATVDTVNIYDNGNVLNYHDNSHGGITAYIGTVNVNGGSLDNFGPITGKSNYGVGISHSQKAATIGEVFLNNGTVNNIGRIDNLTYTGGTYNAQQAVYLYTRPESSHNSTIAFGTGSIGTLTAAGHITGDNWGIVENVQFAEGGSGIVSINAYAIGGDFGFSGLKADYVDFTYGNISLGLSDITGMNGTDDWATTLFNAFGYDNGFYLDTLFGAQSFNGLEDLISLAVTWDSNEFWILRDGIFNTGWSINTDTSFVSWSDASANAVPEPATLAIIGLGLTGLGLARRRRQVK